MKIEEMYPEMLKRYECSVEQERKEKEEMKKKHDEVAQKLKVLIESIISTVRFELENNMQDEICDAYVRFRSHGRAKNPKATVRCELEDENGFTMTVCFNEWSSNSCYHECKFEAMRQFLDFLVDSNCDEAKEFYVDFSLNENLVVFKWNYTIIDRFKRIVCTAFPEGTVRQYGGFYNLKLHMD